jgi:hypothetical protein
LVDFDGDGKLDVISGSYSPGELYLFRGKGNGEFAAGEVIKDSTGRALNAGAASAPFAVDWDGDGDLDLIIGNIDGQVELAVNNGTREKPEYAMPVPMRAADKPIKLNGDAGPTVADWDGDGIPDLLIGDGSGQVVLYRGTNRMKNGTPRLKFGHVLVPGSNGVTGSRLKLCVADFNGDGKLDLLAGDVIFRTPPPRALSPTERQEAAEASRKCEQLGAEYQHALNEAMGVPLPSGTSARDAQERWQRAKETPKVKALWEQYGRAQEVLEKYCPGTQFHGYVWFFARQDVPQRASANAAR